jgi:hypothetical protein
VLSIAYFHGTNSHGNVSGDMRDCQIQYLRVFGVPISDLKAFASPQSPQQQSTLSDGVTGLLDFLHLVGLMALSLTVSGCDKFDDFCLPVSI